MSHILKMIAALVKCSGHARELVIVLVQYLEREHLVELVGLFNKALAQFDPQDAPVVLAAEAAVGQAVESLESEVAAEELQSETPHPEPVAQSAEEAAAGQQTEPVAQPATPPAKPWKAPKAKPTT